MDDPLPHLTLAAGFAALDWAVLGVYFALLVGVGAACSLRKPASTSDYFLGGRAMPVWAVAVSVLATTQSAATFLGVPEQAYRGNLTYVSSNIGNMIAAVIIATVFIPAYYRLGVSTPYQLLETRFGPGAKLAASWAYMIGRVFASGARVFVGAIPVSFAIFGNADPANVALAIAAFIAFGILYTLAGGIASVIWTDVLQVAVYLGAAVVAIAVLWSRIPADAGQVWDALSTGGPDGASKLTVLSLSLDPSLPFTLATACTGFVLLILASHGTDQDLVQRMLTCKDARRGARSVVWGLFIVIPAVLLFAAVGLLLWIHLNRPDLTGRPAPDWASGDAAEVFLKFILNEMPAGAAGLMIAGVMAAGPAGINAGLNSMAGTFISDVYRPARPGRDDRHYLRVGRWCVAAWGVVLGVFALVCIPWKEAAGQTIIDFVLQLMTFAYAGLLGVFFTALFTRRGTTRSAVAALLVGFLATAAMQFWGAVRWTWDGREWGLTPLAWPWRFVIATGLATLVAALPRGKGRSA